MKKSHILYGISVGIFILLILRNVVSAITSFNSSALTNEYLIIGIISLICVIVSLPFLFLSLISIKSENGTKISFLWLLIGAIVLFIASVSKDTYVLIMNINALNESINNNNSEAITNALNINKSNAIISYVFTVIEHVILLATSLFAFLKKDE